MAQVKCIVVTPEATVTEKTVDSVVVPLFDGELGILPGHAPLIGRLGFGELRMQHGGQTERLYVDGGFVQVADDVVSLLTEDAKPIADLDEAEAKTLLAEAQEKTANTVELQAIRQRSLDRARAQIRLAGRR